MSVTLLTIGTTALPNPIAGSYFVATEDGNSENSDFSEAYKRNRERVRADIYTISCKWAVTGAELDIITAAISPVEFEMTFFDLLTNTFVKKIFMIDGQKSGNLIKLENTVANSLWELSLTFVEY